jgi:N-acetylglutamate synthase-like GNAT family acetyltransferase
MVVTDVATTVVAVLGKRVVGVVEFLVEADGVLIQGLAVHPKYRRRGIAHALVEHLEQVARYRGKSMLFLRTINETGNRLIFARLGFVTVGEQPSTKFEGSQSEQVTEVSMQRMLV